MAENYFNIEGVGTDDDADIWQGNAFANAAGNYDSFTYNNLNSPVPAGKLLIIRRLVANVSAAGAVFEVGFADSSSGNTATAPTNPKDMQAVYPFGVEKATKLTSFPCAIVVPAGKFPTMRLGSAVTCRVHAFGVLVDA